MAGNAKSTFVKGFWALLPTAITIMVLVKIYELVSGTIGGGLRKVVVWIVALAIWKPAGSVEKYIPPIVGVVLAIGIIYFVGLFLAMFVGRRIWASAEKRIRSVPIINAIYPSVKQVSDFFGEDRKISFGKVVIVEYPRKGIWSLGFITSRAFDTTESVTGRQMLTVFVPSSPTPFTGYCIQVPKDEIIEIDMPVDSALKYVISGGVIVPEGQGRPTAIEASAPAAPQDAGAGGQGAEMP